MKDVSFFQRIFIATDPVDFRKQAHGLALILELQLGLKPTQGKMLVAFTNRRRDAIKLLYYDSNGYAMWWKVLEKDRFNWPTSPTQGGCFHVSSRELKWLLDGVDLNAIKTHTKLQIY